MIPTLSNVCSLNSPLETDVADYAAGQCFSLEIWLTKLETYLQKNSRDDFRRLLETHGVSVPVAATQGGLLHSQGQRRIEAWDLLTKRLELCQDLGIGVLVVACDVAGALTGQDVQRVQMSLVDLAKQAQQHNLSVALEFQARSTLGNNLQTAASLVAEVGSPHLGLCFDLFHYYVGPSKIEDLRLLTAENLLHVQLCDLADRPRELAADGDRILPGDGDIPLAPLLARLAEINYQRCVSIELMNAQIWQVPALQFGEIGMTALRGALGIASME